MESNLQITDINFGLSHLTFTNFYENISVCQKKPDKCKIIISLPFKANIDHHQN